MEDENKELVPKKQSLFPLSPEDIVDNALQNLDEKQARRVTEKAADEVVRLAVEKRKAEYRNSAAQEEMRNLINNANLLTGESAITKSPAPLKPLPERPMSRFKNRNQLR